VAVVEARRTRDSGQGLALLERERVRVAPRGGAEFVPRRIVQPLPEPRPIAVVVPHRLPARTRTRRERRPWSDERKRRFRRRFLPTVTALVLAPAPIARVLLGGGTNGAPVPLPPISFRPAPAPRLAPLRVVEPARGGSSSVLPDVVWRRSISLGLPYHGRLIDGVQLPVNSPYWVTWDPALDRVPDRGYRRYGSAKLIHLLLSVTKAYHDEHPNAARLVIGDISRLGGGPLDEHVSHQNGLDVDVYYPRVDQREVAPTTVAQVDVPLAQDLLNLFLAAKPEFVFVGPHLPQLHGPAGVVEPLVGHDNHMHVRIYPPS
jgi:Penicillin-insensitive murein endopeptidase